MSFGELNDFLDFMPDTVQIVPYIETSVNGVIRYSTTPLTYPARIEMKNRLVVDRSGRTVVSRGRVYLGTTVPPSIKDKIILPAQYTPSEPPVISVNPQNDDSGNHHITIEIG